MNKKSIILLILLIISLAFLAIEILYISKTNTVSKKEVLVKKQIVKLVGLPDLALNSQDIYIRHRSLVSTSNIYQLDPTLISSAKGTFIYNHSNINKHVSKITNKGN